MAEGSLSSRSHAIFINTNLDTHLVITVSDEDTVLHLKQKILFEHCRCFPVIGEITVQSVKVKRRSCFYHLSDSMIVKCAFNGVNNTWFLYVDAASGLVVPTENLLRLEPTIDGGNEINLNKVITLEGQVSHGSKNGELSASLDAGRKIVDPKIDKTFVLSDKRTISGKLKKNDLVMKTNEVPEIDTEHEKDESALEQESAPKKKQRILDKKSFTSKEDLYKGNVAGLLDSKKETSKPENSFPEKSAGEALQTDPVPEEECETDRKIGESQSNNIFLEKSLEDQQKITNAGLSIAPLEGLGNKRTKKKKSLKESKRQDSPKQASEHNERDVGKIFEAETASDKTVKSMDRGNVSVFSGKEMHDSSMQETREGITAPGSLMVAPHCVPADLSVVDNVDVDSHLAVEKNKDFGTKMGYEADVAEQAVASGVKKPKRVKKVKVGTVKSLNLSSVQESGNPNANNLLLTDTVVRDDALIGTSLSDKTEKKEKALPPNGDRELIPSAVQNDAEMNFKDIATKTGKLGEKSKKKSKKASKAPDGDNFIHETQKKDTLLPRTKKAGLRIDDRGCGIANVEDDKIDKAEKVETVVGDPKINSSQVFKNNAADRSEKQIINKDTVTLKSLDASRDVKALNNTSKRKKLKKTETSDATVNVSDCGVKKGDIFTVRSQPEKALQLTQTAQGTVDPSDDKVKKTGDTSYSTSEDLTSSSDGSKKEVFGPLEKKKKNSNLQKPSLKNVCAASSDDRVESKTAPESPRHQNPVNDVSSQVPSNPPEYRVVERPREETSTDKANSHMGKDATSNEGDEINFVKYFVPKVRKPEAVAPVKGLVEEDAQIRKPSKKLKAVKKIKKVSEYSVGSTLDEQETVSSSENRAQKQKRTLSVQVSLSKEERTKHPSQARVESLPRTKVVNASVTAAPVPPYPKSSYRANTKPSLKDNSAARADSSSDTGSSVRRVHKNKGHHDVQSLATRDRVIAKKGNQMGEVVNNLKKKKSLLATSKTIFEDSSAETSQDEGEVNNSEASTRTPSYNSPSSESSEGEDDVDLDSVGNGSYMGKRKDNGGSDVTKSQSKNMSLDFLLRSSRSYKKAKFTASQSQNDDTESQPIDFVLDTQD